MAKEPILTDLTSQYSTQSTINSNWDAIQTAFQNTLSLDGSSPNAMLADLDLNNNDLLNAKTINTSRLLIDGAVITSTSATPAWRGAWVTSTAYALNDIVESSGSTYIAVVAHTSGTFATDLSGGKWELFVSKGDAGLGDVVAANNLSDLTSAGTALLNLGLTATAAELNTLDGITATVAELNKMDGVTATSTELNYTDGVTSPIQTQLDAKAPLASPALTGTPTAPTAATGTNTTQVATTAYAYAAGVGSGQTWQDVSGSRVGNTSYQNLTGKPIVTSIRAVSSSSFRIQVSTDDLNWVDVDGHSFAGVAGASAIVPDNHYYRTQGMGAVSSWAELR